MYNGIHADFTITDRLLPFRSRRLSRTELRFRVPAAHSASLSRPSPNSVRRCGAGYFDSQACQPQRPSGERKLVMTVREGARTQVSGKNSRLCAISHCEAQLIAGREILKAAA